MAIDYVRIRIRWKKNQAAGLGWVEMGERGRGLVNRVGGYLHPENLEEGWPSGPTNNIEIRGSEISRVQTDRLICHLEFLSLNL